MRVLGRIARRAQLVVLRTRVGDGRKGSRHRLLLRRARTPVDDDAKRRHYALELRSRGQRDERDALRRCADGILRHGLRLRRTARVERRRGRNPHRIRLFDFSRRRRGSHDDSGGEHRLRGDEHSRLVPRREHKGDIFEQCPQDDRTARTLRLYDIRGDERPRVRSLVKKRDRFPRPHCFRIPSRLRRLNAYNIQHLQHRRTARIDPLSFYTLYTFYTAKLPTLPLRRTQRPRRDSLRPQLQQHNRLDRPRPRLLQYHPLRQARRRLVERDKKLLHSR